MNEPSHLHHLVRLIVPQPQLVLINTYVLDV